MGSDRRRKLDEMRRQKNDSPGRGRRVCPRFLHISGYMETMSKQDATRKLTIKKNEKTDFLHSISPTSAVRFRRFVLIGPLPSTATVGFFGFAFAFALVLALALDFGCRARDCFLLCM